MTATNVREASAALSDRSGFVGLYSVAQKRVVGANLRFRISKSSTQHAGNSASRSALSPGLRSICCKPNRVGDPNLGVWLLIEFGSVFQQLFRAAAEIYIRDDFLGLEGDAVMVHADINSFELLGEVGDIIAKAEEVF